MCSRYERPASMGGLMSIRATSVISLVKDYGGSERDVDKILHIENELFPIIQAKIKRSE